MLQITKPLLERQRRGQTQLFIKKRIVAGKTYIVCRNEEEAEHDRRERQVPMPKCQCQSVNAKPWSKSSMPNSNAATRP